MKQEIVPALNIFSSGDCIVFRLRAVPDGEGKAFLRTNLGRAAVKRQEIIDHTEKNTPILACDWHDLPMRKADDGCWEIELPLIEVGCFEAKCWFLRFADNKQLWADGTNFHLKVEPPRNICGNTMYTVFPRQFGPNMHCCAISEKERKSCEMLDKLGYTVIPPAGTFRDVIKQLDFIIGELHSRIIQLLPIHPVPTVYGKMGRFGSPFASLDYFSVNPALAEFDEKATPLEQFLELVDGIHARDARVFIDIPVNHTGWASRLQTEHPDWFVRKKDGTFVNPGAWEVVWADLCKLNYRRHEVHTLMADIFLYWCRHGVDGFRCDAGYMLPLEAWHYIVARVRQEYPDTIFLLEGLGGPARIQERLLLEADLNWAYSELFQNFSRRQIEHYYPYASRMSMKRGCFINYAETHDNSRLAAVSKTFSKMRTAMNALFAHNGAFGITNGVEWFATEQINVHEAHALNWGCEDNQVQDLRRLQTLLETNPAFFAGAKTELVEVDGNEALALLRTSVNREHVVLALVNLDTAKEAKVAWAASDFDAFEGAVDLLGGGKVRPVKREHLQELMLKPGEVMCLVAGDEALHELEKAMQVKLAEPEVVARQRKRAEMLRIYSIFNGYGDVSEINIDVLVEKFLHSPEDFCAEVSGLEIPAVTVWQEGPDQNRIVMVPAGDILLVKCESPFRVEIKNGKVPEAVNKSLQLAKDGYFACITGLENADCDNRRLNIELRIFKNGKVRKVSGEICLLARSDRVTFRNIFSRKEVGRGHLYALCSNSLGGMSQMRAEWGTLRSKYDAVLAANLNSDYPVDRQVMFSRCRGWLICSDYSQELNLSCLESFAAGSDNAARWTFKIPAGQGKSVPLEITLQMATEGNAVQLKFHRQNVSPDSQSGLNGDIPIKIILRPDIEDRVNHNITRAMDGPEAHFPRSISCMSRGFEFKPARSRCLEVHLDRGAFVPQPEWQYMVGLPVEHERGLEAHTDLFSPGFFEFELKANDCGTLLATVDASGSCGESKLNDFKWNGFALPEAQAPETALYHGIKRFIVKRDQYHTVIAGYPWFLDWGRDTLICLRGMIAAGYLQEAKDIIMQFAGFERQGTIPNMIRGNDHSNRDTSDAPLWLFVAIQDYCRAVGDEQLLKEKCGRRTIFDILLSIAENYRIGTPNGIAVDEESGLVFSPSHFTWMDTNYPACTPREGYPVEIQALWLAALDFLAPHDKLWLNLRDNARMSLQEMFWLRHRDFLADCLHARPGTPARRAVPDDACRSNQLLAVTLNAVEHDIIMRGVIRSSEALLIPGAIRSLADAEVEFKLPVTNGGHLLNDPEKPFWPRYRGDEDTRRKPAYHNGTAWTWPFPSYCEALYQVGGENSRERALTILMSCRELFESGTPGQVPEILDGGAPHRWRGCGAQAWGITELYRVCKVLNGELKQ
ncbi:amylo-alpha-1,6-glucosidase [Lentisphaerota bacterium ZTH]|nr:glycogen debranching enzyme N-terminal domain-containing protein [Lentisphaerota bacterium]WET07396.1 amylo-alpha-1,6-glucosidase [Lentisphaerota bacterium ZTH]